MPAEPAAESYQRKLLSVIAGKLGQLKAGAPNLILIGLEPDWLLHVPLDDLLKSMKARVEKQDAALLARSRFTTPAAFLKQYQVLSGILCYFLPKPAASALPSLLWLNKTAKYPLLPQVQTSLRQLARDG